MPARVVLQDFTGVPAVVDLAAMRDAMADLGGDPARVNPLVPGRPRDRPLGPDRRVGRRRRVRVQRRARVRAQRRALPAAALGADRVPRPAGRPARDRASSTRSTSSTSRPSSRTARTTTDASRSRTRSSGTDSHTTMINGLGVLGYGVGGIEAEAVLLGQPLYQPMPRIVGVRLDGRAAAALDGDRPRARHHRDAARVRRGGRVRGVRGRRARGPRARGPGDDRQHEPRVRRDDDAVPDRRRDARLPAPDRPAADARRPRRGLRQGAGPVAGARRRAGVRRRCSSSTSRPWSRRWPGPAAAGPGRAGGPARQLPRRPSRRPWAPSGTGSRRADDAPGVRPRIGGDRRHHVVHQHLQPDRDGRRRAARPERRRPRAAGLAHRQDIARARLPGRHRVPRARRPDGAARRRSASRSPATAARPASATPGRWTEPIAARHRGRRAGRRGRPVGQPQLRGAHPSPRARRATSPPRRSWWRSRSRAASTSTSRPSRSAPTATAGRSCLADIWPTPDEIRAVIADAIDPELFRQTYASCSRATSAGGRCRSRPATGTRGTGSTYIARPAVLRRAHVDPAPLPRHRRRARARASWATP